MAAKGDLMETSNDDDQTLLKPSEVAELFCVDAKTVTRWAKRGKLPYIRTLGGHRRYPTDVVHELLEKGRETRIN